MRGLASGFGGVFDFLVVGVSTVVGFQSGKDSGQTAGFVGGLILLDLSEPLDDHDQVGRDFIALEFFLDDTIDDKDQFAGVGVDTNFESGSVGVLRVVLFEQAECLDP